MKSYKNIVCVLLSVIFLLGSITIIPFHASAAGNGTLVVDGDYKAVYYDDGTAMLFEASVDEENITVPSVIGGYTVTEISQAFKNNKNIKSVTIPDTVTGILGCAFEGCTNLESITIPDSVTKIGSSAFEKCESLKSIDIPDTVTEIDSEAFSMCKSLEKITIPESVTYIGERAFDSCKKLSTINICQNSELEIEGNAFNSTKWYDSQPDGVVYLDRFALGYKGNMPENLKIDFKSGTTAVCSGMFADDSPWDKDNTALVSVTFPDSLRFIGASAFNRCVNLQTVEFPDSLTHIGENAFAYCTSIKSAKIPEGVADMRSTFVHSGLESITLKGNPEMWYRAFTGCENLKEVRLSDTLENIQMCVFEGCTNLESITIPDSVKEIEWAAFMDCDKLINIKHNGKIYKVDSEAFLNTAWHNSQPDGFVYFADVLLGYKGNASTMEELIVKDGTKAIAGSAFSRLTNLKKLTLPDGLVVIGSSAFRQTGVESVDIPESVEFIGHFAFSNCKALTSVAIRGSGIIEYEAFANCNNLMCVTVSASVDEIQDAALGAYYGMAADPLYLDGFTIFGYANSEAERYAQKHGLAFSNLSKLMLGDSDIDGRITVKDATLIQKAVADIVILTDSMISVSDVTADNQINVKDATMIQKYVAGIITEFAKTQ